MIKIIPYQRDFQNEINTMLLEISNEFKINIFNKGTPIQSNIFDKYWVAQREQKLIGTIAILAPENGYAILKNMFVKKEFRGKEFGVSSALLSKALAWCKSKNYNIIYLGTMEQFIAAQKFYENNGFQRIDRNELPKSFINNPIDSVFYKKIFESSFRV